MISTKAVDKSVEKPAAARGAPQDAWDWSALPIFYATHQNLYFSASYILSRTNFPARGEFVS
jgi:hypothetical protein